MKLKKSMLVLAITFGLTVASPAFATDATPSPSDSPSMSRADTLALIQDQYITELNSELARFLAVKKIFQTDPASLAAFNKVFADFMGSKTTIENDVANPNSDLSATLAFSQEETVEFNNTLLLMEKQVTTKKTITCMKGKLVKKVSAFAPKCPTGYKKK